MDDKDDSKKKSYDASLPLPVSEDDSAQPDKSQDFAAELVRKKVDAAYATEPDAVTEEKDLQKIGPAVKKSKHQQFVYDLTTSGKPLYDVQKAWHDYYDSLTDVEKREVWQEFYSTHAQATHHSSAIPSIAPSRKSSTKPASKKRAVKKEPVKNEMREAQLTEFKVRTKLTPKDHLKSLIFGLSMGLLVVVVLLFSFFNERFIAPLVQPSRNVNNIPLISTGAVGSDPEVIVPKINVEIPVVYGVNTVDDNQVNAALEQGVVHYADTADPGQNGNAVVVGHSSNNILNKGKYKFAFVLLHRLEIGDTFYLQKDGKRYTYQVYQKKIVSPTDVSVLGPTDKTATATLITCDPPGTSLNRLVVIGQQISPDVATNAPAGSDNSTVATTSKVIPGNSPTLWSRLWSWL